jgi:hypothetical protein
MDVSLALRWCWRRKSGLLTGCCVWQARNNTSGLRVRVKHALSPCHDASWSPWSSISRAVRTTYSTSVCLSQAIGQHHTSTMKLLSLVTAALLPLTALAAKKPTGDLFSKYNAKQLSASGSFKLDDKTYGQLTKAPRDYSVAVLLTALEARFGCGLCNDFQPEYDLLAKSWSKGDKAGEGRLLFGTLDFLDGKATFQSVRCLGIYMDMQANLIGNRCNCKPRLSYCSSILPLDPMRRATLLPPASTSSLGEFLFNS